eukprot:7007694-Prymnesium_polylepis.1
MSVAGRVDAVGELASGSFDCPGGALGGCAKVATCWAREVVSVAYHESSGPDASHVLWRCQCGAGIPRVGHTGVRVASCCASVTLSQSCPWQPTVCRRRIDFDLRAGRVRDWVVGLRRARVF